MIPKAIIFDLDATLITTDDVSYEAIADYLREKHAHELTKENYGHTIGHSNMDFIRVIEQKCGLKVNAEEMLHEIRARANYDHMQLKPGAQELLDYLRERKITIALATTTSRDRLERKTARLNLIPYFMVIVTGDEVENMKPAPDLYLEALKRLNLDAKDCYVVEDNESGIQSGVAAGCAVLFVPNSYVNDAPAVAARYKVSLFHDLHGVKDFLNNN